MPREERASALRAPGGKIALVASALRAPEGTIFVSGKIGKPPTEYLRESFRESRRVCSTNKQESLNKLDVEPGFCFALDEATNQGTSGGSCRAPTLHEACRNVGSTYRNPLCALDYHYDMREMSGDRGTQKTQYVELYTQACRKPWLLVRSLLPLSLPKRRRRTTDHVSRPETSTRRLASTFRPGSGPRIDLQRLLQTHVHKSSETLSVSCGVTTST